MDSCRALFFIPAVSFLLMGFACAQLSTDFYNDICPDLESLVRSTVTEKLQETPIAAQATLRLFFHDCFVRGCDASVLIASPDNTAEKDHPIDLSLAGDGFDTVIRAKAAVDRDPGCRNKVSCADVLALATRDVISLTGGPFYQVELGRRDGRISTKASVQHSIPLPNFDLDQLNNMFAKHGLNQADMIALSGAHTLGFAHCSKFSKRIYGFNQTHPIDPTLNISYAMELRELCPIDAADPDVVIDMDPTSHTFDKAYFENLQLGKGLFSSDQVLFTDPRSRPNVEVFASSTDSFFQAFVTAITKLGRVGVKTGTKGEIRIDCTRPN